MLSIESTSVEIPSLATKILWKCSICLIFFKNLTISSSSDSFVLAWANNCSSRLSPQTLKQLLDKNLDGKQLRNLYLKKLVLVSSNSLSSFWWSLSESDYFSLLGYFLGLWYSFWIRLCYKVLNCKKLTAKVSIINKPSPKPPRSPAQSRML